MGAFNDKARRRERARSQKAGAESLKTLLAILAFPFIIFFWMAKAFYWVIKIFFGIFLWPFKLFSKKH